MIERIDTAPGLAPAVGPYSQAVVAGGLVFVTGQVPRSVRGPEPETVEEQAEACIANLRSVLKAAGSSLDRVVKVNAYLTDPAQRDPFNAVYARHFADAKPARTTVCVSIWDIAMELECVAVVDEKMS